MRDDLKFGTPGSVMLRKDAFLDEEINSERVSDEDDRKDAAEHDAGEPPARRPRHNNGNDGRQFIRNP